MRLTTLCILNPDSLPSELTVIEFSYLEYVSVKC